MGHISDRADKFAKKFHTEPPEVLPQAEQEAQFAKNFMTTAGLREQWQKLRADKEKGGGYAGE